MSRSCCLAPRSASRGVERALVVTVDVTSGEVTEIDLPKVHVGPVEPVSQEPVGVLPLQLAFLHR